MGILRRTQWRNVGFVLSAASLAACVSPPDADERGIPIGALLPFTGDMAASGATVERALLWAVETINDAGGVAGQPLRLVTRDTHSNWKQGLEAARALLDEDGVVAILGPDDDDLAKQMVPLIKQREVVQISGGVTSPRFSTIDDGGFFFRTSPSALLYGTALAERMQADGVGRAVALTSDDEFGFGFANVVTQALTGAGIAPASPVSFRSDQSSYSDTLAQVASTESDAIILGAYPRAGAAIVQEWAILGGKERWYFAPTVKADVFVSNVPPGVLEGMCGVAPKVGEDADAFAAAFAKRWPGEPAVLNAYFYYDAVALLALATESAAYGSGGGVPSGDLVRARLAEVSRSPGTEVPWSNLGAGLAAVRQGEQIDYRGASGALDLDDNGDLVTGAATFWCVQSDRIVTEEH